MPAVVFDGDRVALEAGRRPRSVRTPGEALVALRLGGVCSTDREIAGGYLAFRGVLGHEFVGTVLESDRAELVGKRVVGSINCGCGTCAECRSGRGNHCGRRSVLGIAGRDGVFQDEFLVPDRNLWLVPEGVPDDHAVFAEPLAAAYRIEEQVALHPGLAVAILGDGKLGLLVAHALADRVGSVDLIGRRPGRVPLPKNAREIPAGAAPGRGYDLAVEATGSAAALQQALALVRPGGTVVLKTTCAAEHRLSLAPVVIDEITIVGSRCGPFPRALARLAADPPPLRAFIAARFPLARGAEAVRKAAEPGVLKVLIEGGPSS